MNKFLFVGAFALAAVLAAGGAQAQIAAPNVPLTNGVHYGSGNPNDHFTTDTGYGTEIGLKSKISNSATEITPAGNLYVFASGQKISFDFSIDPAVLSPGVSSTQSSLTGSTALMTLTNMGNGNVVSFNPFLISDNTLLTGNSAGGIQNSEQLAFLSTVNGLKASTVSGPNNHLGAGPDTGILGFDLNGNDTYKVELSLSNIGGNSEQNLDVVNFIQQGSGVAGFAGGVPEPSSWALMILGFGAAGAMLRRRKLVTA